MSGRNTLPRQSHWGLLQFYRDHDDSSAYPQRAQSASSGILESFRPSRGRSLGPHPSPIRPHVTRQSHRDPRYLSLHQQLGGHPQIIKQFQLRFPEPLKNMLDFLCANHFRMNPHPLIMTLVCDALSVALEEYLSACSQNGFEHGEA